MKSTKKLLISLVVLVIAFATTAATTFAWFTLNANPEIGGYDINVKTESDGLFLAVTSDYTATPGAYSVDLTADQFWKEIFYSEAQITALTAAEYYGKETVSSEEETEFGAVTKAQKEAFLKAKLTNFKFDAFTPMTKEMEKTPADEETSTPAVMETVLDLAARLALKAENGTAAVGANNVTAKNSGSYLKFTIHFRSTEEYKVSLNNDVDKKASVKATGTTPASKLKMWKASDKSDYTKLADAETDTTVTAGTAISTRAANAVRIGFYAGTEANIWNPNYDIGYNGTKNLAADYRDALMGTTTTPVTMLNEFNFSTSDTTLVTLKTNDSNGFYEGKMEVSVWLEGWDGDCLNAILKDIFTVNLAFKGVAVNAVP